MGLEDKENQNARILREMQQFPWVTSQVQKVAALCDYQLKLERVQRNLRAFSKFEEIRSDLEFLNQRFQSAELEQVNAVFSQVESFYLSLEHLQNEVSEPDLYSILELNSLESLLFDMRQFQSIFTPQI